MVHWLVLLSQRGLAGLSGALIVVKCAAANLDVVYCSVRAVVLQSRFFFTSYNCYYILVPGTRYRLLQVLYDHAYVVSCSSSVPGLLVPVFFCCCCVLSEDRIIQVGYILLSEDRIIQFGYILLSRT